MDDINNCERVSSRNLVITTDTTNDSVRDSSYGNNGYITKFTFEGLGSLQSRHADIITDRIKNIFGISHPKAW